MPIVDEATNYDTIAAPPSFDSINNLAAFNNLNVPINDNVWTLIKALNCMKVGGDIGLTQLQQQQQQQHTCGINSLMDCNASMIATGCTKKYQKSPVPPDYMCHLCFSKDHFIRDCPQVNEFILLI